ELSLVGVWTRRASSKCHPLSDSVSVSAICAACVDRFPQSVMEHGRSGPRTDALRPIIKQYQDCRFRLYHRAMSVLPIQLDRARRTPLAAQIYAAIREGIENGRLASGARLPSWQDLASQLGVSRGTVRVAYERLIAEQFAIGLGPAGTRVTERQFRSSIPDRLPEAPLVPDVFYEFGNAPLVFQMGVPAQDAFPFKLWTRIL